MSDPLDLEASPNVSDVPARLAEVRRRIAEVERQAGREAGSVRLIAVSKGKPAEAIRAAYSAGQRDFGENYAQELDAKAEALRDLDGIRWHAIGQIQRNKVKQVIQAAHILHAVDREELAREIGKRAVAAGIRVDVLVELSLGGEAQKGGCTPDALGPLLALIRSTEGLRAVGLMTVPPANDDPEGARPFFAALRALRDGHGGVTALPELSMGMTHDYPIAIEEGATLVRVGTAIFGARHYT